MDYSLLVGVDKERNALVVAIIDFIRSGFWGLRVEGVQGSGCGVLGSSEVWVWG
jgi:hypothetical protein